MPSPARRQREIEHTRSDILHAAARALARLGFEHATVHDIATEAGYSAPTLYAYFKGKQEIIDALIATVMDENRRVFEAEPPSGLTFPQRLEFLFGGLAELSDKWGEARMLLLQLMRRSEPSKETKGPSRKEDSYVNQLAGWLKRNSTSPRDLDGHDPEDVAYIMRGIIHGVSLLGQRDRFRNAARSRYALALQICLHGIGGAEPNTAHKEK